MDTVTATQEIAYGGKTYFEGEQFECDSKYTRLLVALGKVDASKDGKPAKKEMPKPPEDSGEDKGDAVSSEKTDEDEAIVEKDDEGAEKGDKDKLKDKRAKKYETRVTKAEG